MKPPVFDYIAPTSIAAAVAALAEAGGEAKVLAGGQSLMPMLNFRLLRPSILVDINRIAGLELHHRDRRQHSHRRADAAFCARNLAADRQHFPVLSAAMTHVAHLAIRNRGTIGGSLSHADPAAELPMMALLLDAELHVAAVSGARTVSARDFFLDTMTVDLDGTELLTEIVLPKLPPQTGWGFEEVARRHGDFALAAVAATLTLFGGQDRAGAHRLDRRRPDGIARD